MGQKSRCSRRFQELPGVLREFSPYLYFQVPLACFPGETGHLNK
jgi:hypothetical protein